MVLANKNLLLFLFISILFFHFNNVFSNNNYNCFPPDTIKKDTISTEIIIYQYDTLVVYDTVVYYDTLEYKKKYRLSTDLFLSPFLINSKLFTNNEQLNDFVEFIEQAENYSLSYLFGLAVNINYSAKGGSVYPSSGVASGGKKLIASLGMSYINVRKKVDYNLVNITLTDKSYYNVFDNSYWNVIFIDSFFQTTPDTTWIVVYDSTYVPSIDSIFVNDYDTISNSANYNETNKYSYLEIPLIFGYTILGSKKLFIDIKSGIITGILIRKNGKTVLPVNQKEIVDVSALPLIKTNFSIYLSAKINYQVNNKFRIFVEPYYKKSLKSIYAQNYLLMEKRARWGFRFGMEYLF